MVYFRYSEILNQDPKVTSFILKNIHIVKIYINEYRENLYRYLKTPITGFWLNNWNFSFTGVLSSIFSYNT